MDLPLFVNPVIGKIYNGIFIIVNKYIKYISFILFKKNYIIAKLIYIFLDKVIKI